MSKVHPVTGPGTEIRLKTYYGIINGNKLRFLNHVPFCDKENCPLKKICTLIPQKEKCTYIFLYVNEIYTDWVHPVNGIGDKLTQAELDIIGMQLMPLYQHLIRFQMEISSLRKSTYTSKAGVESAYPQFKEFRETQKAIAEIIRSNSLILKWREKFNLDPSKGLPGLKDNLVEEIASGNRNGQIGGYEGLVRMHREMEETRKTMIETYKESQCDGESNNEETE
jgi:hypothetical protein